MRNFLRNLLCSPTDFETENKRDALCLRDGRVVLKSRSFYWERH
jgi:hypothetical protein